MEGYVLSLENGKYYVGITSNFDERVASHLNGCGSAWTKLHKPISVIERFEGSKLNERNKTLDYMRRFGWNNTRGGGWTSVILKKPQSL